MCHPWLAAGVTGLIAVLLAREIAPVLRRSEPGAPLDHGLLGEGVRAWFRTRIEPLVDVLLAAGIRADAVTAFQLAMSVISGAAYARGWLFTAGWMLLAAGTLDVLDGGMARKGGAAGPRGAFVDSVVDRYGEFAVFVGLAIHFREGWPLWVVLAALFGAFMVSYTRARGEGLGVQCAIGFLQRAERYVIIGGGSLIGTLAAHLACTPSVAYGVLVTGLLAVAILANVTALQRAIVIVRRLA